MKKYLPTSLRQDFGELSRAAQCKLLSVNTSKLLSVNKKGLALSDPEFIEGESKGFTLIELLVVIAIIAILAVMGFAAFTGLTSRGNDDRRMVDIKAVADALEVKKRTNENYQLIDVTDFAGGVAPRDPDSASVYCYDEDTTNVIPNPGAWGASRNLCPAGFTSINGAVPPVGANIKYFKICALKADNITIVCQGSKQ